MSDANRHYLEGLGHYGKMELAESVAAFERALEAKPEWTDALHGLSMALLKSNRLEEALAIGKRLVELDPDDPAYRTSLSMIYQRLDRIEEAETEQSKSRMLAWKQELETNPNAPPPPGAAGMQP
jgi:Flp pilus assembly protein TadD